MTHTQTPADRLRGALVRVLHRDPFFSVPALHAPFREAPGLGTMATDGLHVLYDPEAVATWSDSKLEYVVAHEGAHILLRHPLRFAAVLDTIPEADRAAAHGVANVAADYIVNHHLDRSGWPPITDGLRDPMGRGGSHSFEALFRELWAEREADEGGSGDEGDEGDEGGSGNGSGEAPTPHDPSTQCPDPNGTGGVLVPSPEALEERYGAGSETANREAMQRDLCQVAINAERAAQRGGREAGSVAREIVSEIGRGRMDWRPLLRDWLRDRYRPDGWTYRRPSRRGLGSGLYLPRSRYDEGAECLVVAVDVSGSVSDDTVREILGEVESVRDEIRPTTTHVVFFDTRVRRVDTVDAFGSLTPDAIPGGGGTSLRCPFEWMEAEGINPAGIVVCTDGYGWDVRPGSAPSDEDPDVPTLWALWGHYADEADRGTLEPFPWGDAVGVLPDR